MKDKDVLFITGLFPKELEKEIIKNSLGNVQNAANVLQWNIVEGLNSNLEKPITVINSMYLGAFPFKYKKLFIQNSTFLINNKSQGINIGFINLVFLKHFSRYISLKKYFKKFLNKKNGDYVILAYALTNVNLLLFKYLKKLNSQIKCCIIVPDLPQYMDTTSKNNYIRKVLKSISLRMIYRDIKYVDNCVFLTEKMKEKIPDIPYTVIEGISTDTKYSLETESKLSTIKTILYTGTLNERYGVLNLLEAFSKIENNDYRLIICGDGDSQAKVREYSNSDKRISYKGLLPREEILTLQQKATVLINPRMNNEEFCKYSFPSKLLEYLSSGTPVIAYKLDGIPDEYDPYIYYIEDNTIESIIDKIIQVCETNENELNLFAKDAFDFVKKYKNKKTQCAKIIDLIS